MLDHYKEARLLVFTSALLATHLFWDGALASCKLGAIIPTNGMKGSHWRCALSARRRARCTDRRNPELPVQGGVTGWLQKVAILSLVSLFSLLRI